MSEGWKYVLQYGDDRLELTEGKLTVGRSRHCDLSIQEPSISRKHVFLSVGSGQIGLQDLGSSNGTFVNDDKVESEWVVGHGDTLRLGNAVVQVEIGARDATDPEPPPRPRPLEPPETGDTRELIPVGPPRQPPWDLRTPDLSATLSAMGPLPDDPDADPTKRLGQSIDWNVLQGVRGGFLPRLGAAVIDAVWVSALAWTAQVLGGPLVALAAPLVLVVVTWLGWSYWGTTPGKRVFRLYVYAVDAEVPGRPGIGLVVAALRIAGCFLSFLLFGLGFIAIAFSPARLALHDRLAGTFVVRRSA